MRSGFVSFAISSIHASSFAFLVGGFGEVEDTVALIVRTSVLLEVLAPGRETCARGCVPRGGRPDIPKSMGRVAGFGPKSPRELDTEPRLRCEREAVEAAVSAARTDGRVARVGRAHLDQARARRAARFV